MCSACVFRSSLPTTLRTAGYPRPTQDSLPAVGQTLLDGLFTRRVPMRGFRVLPTSHPPLPSLPGAIGSTEAIKADECHRSPLFDDRRRTWPATAGTDQRFYFSTSCSAEG